MICLGRPYIAWREGTDRLCQSPLSNGYRKHAIDGCPIAYEGHKTSCGAILLASNDQLHQA
ncbi:PAAR domain-containing protein [Duganella lactea]|uniref:PAAR domain-containing protein n=1 Tax=Duganella lactea TaxID=2692173 RepID=UPI0035308FD4